MTILLMWMKMFIPSSILSPSTYLEPHMHAKGVTKEKMWNVEIESAPVSSLN